MTGMANQIIKACTNVKVFLDTLTPKYAILAPSLDA